MPFNRASRWSRRKAKRRLANAYGWHITRNFCRLQSSRVRRVSDELGGVGGRRGEEVKEVRHKDYHRPSSRLGGRAARRHDSTCARRRPATTIGRRAGPDCMILVGIERECNPTIESVASCLPSLAVLPDRSTKVNSHDFCCGFSPANRLELPGSNGVIERIAQKSEKGEI